MDAHDLVWLGVAAGLVGLGVYGVLVAGHLLRKLLALNLLGAAVFLLMVVLGRRGDAAPDPVSQAMVLTGIVVAVSATAFGLALMLALYRRSGEAALDDESGASDDPGGD
ncbi:MAG: NADH-quinone oxidoreductase subunit K [Xanthomonadales bacterium]|nr:NADH-quinone oxidoreductase subunit K [Xanthomonadales bacterium]